MADFSSDSSSSTTTTHKVVIPFYVYAALSFLTATVMLFFTAGDFTGHYFHPHILSITHIMALGWATMIIMGASHQFIPVLVEKKLYSKALAHLSFLCAAAGIPLLVYAFFNFRFDWLAKSGSKLIIAAIICFLVNLIMSAQKSRSGSIHILFVVTSALWLLATTLIGLFLVYNFTRPFLDKDSLHYLSMHAHLGIVGWFLLLIIGVASKLIPMFLISKYNDSNKLWYIYGLINLGLIAFLAIFILNLKASLYLLPAAMVAVGVILFCNYCYLAYKLRLRKSVDAQLKISLGAITMMLVPILFLVCIIVLLLRGESNPALLLAYGFTVFFGWITAIIIGMTFKTLPFIVWNKVYHSSEGQTNPKDLFSTRLFKVMLFFYLMGFALFVAGILSTSLLALQAGAFVLIVTAVLYNSAVLQILLHKPSAG